MQTIVSVLLLLVAPSTFSYPVFGTKRYQRASYSPAYPVYQPQSIYGDEPVQYNAYMSPTLDDSYYYQPPRQDRHPNYGMPTYHGNYQPIPFYYVPAPGVYEYPQDAHESPIDSLHEEMAQEDNFPEGQEVWFERPGHNQDSLSRVNAAFLRNLMLYNDQYGRQSTQDDESNSQNNEYDYDEWWNTGNNDKPRKVQTPSYQNDEKEDKDVQELKALVNKHRKEHEAMYSNQDLRQEMPTYNQDYEPEYDDTWINWDTKRSAPKKVQPEQIDAKKPVKSTKSSTTTQKPPKKAKTTNVIEVKHGGQKEIVLPRPATPVRHPFRSSVLTNAIDESKKSNTNKPPPGAIYDTIKQILDMEGNIGEKSHTQQKRFVSNEESLVQQLNGLKRHYSA